MEMTHTENCELLKDWKISEKLLTEPRVAVVKESNSSDQLLLQHHPCIGKLSAQRYNMLLHHYQLSSHMDLVAMEVAM